MRFSGGTYKITEVVFINLFVVLFVYAAASKLLDFQTFEVQLAQSPLLSAYAGFLAVAVPVTELGIAVLLLTRRTVIWGLVGFFLMMVMFSAYIFFILNYADFVPCSCGGVLEKMSWGQHLVFNLVFVVFAGLLLFFRMDRPVKRRFVLLGGQVVLGVGVVAVLFAFSERKMRRNNGFVRRYVPHLIEKVLEVALPSNSFYIAGLSDDKIYLGNYKAPLYLTEVEVKNGFLQERRIGISNTNLPFQRSRIAVDYPFFYLADGTVPIIFKGELADGMAYPVSDGPFFNHFVIGGDGRIGIVSLSNNGNISLGVSAMRTGDSLFVTNDQILTKQIDGLFDSDGVLLWNQDNEKFIYVYRYRNSYLLIDKDMKQFSSGKTIDTIGTAILDLAYHKRSDEMVLGHKTVVVNRAGATDGDFLFVESDRLGRFDAQQLEVVSKIIDVYAFKDFEYRFSFHLYHEPRQRLMSFAVFKGLLISIIDDRLTIHKMQSDFFSSDSSEQYTARYQE